MYGQPRWSGPVAATVPAGVGGQIVQVPDTYEVKAARNAFFDAYNDQLDKIHSIRYGTHNYGHGASKHSSGSSYQLPTSVLHYRPPTSVTTYHHPTHSDTFSLANIVPPRDTPEVASAKAQFFRIYKEQAAAAAAAPDDHQQTHHYNYF
ncbi:hypothetical protein Pmani_011089 [Petrolisthes manimaculis]|uniref:Uncharacterized protein n=1 Tax=Petrolisthes manimaculis TaxID=1843537 RepID=A0AAE1Q003_9EUCA|nr:hypothetical protein Pmani_011089 [Petrolisthes manimaculis]